MIRIPSITRRGGPSILPRREQAAVRIVCSLFLTAAVVALGPAAASAQVVYAWGYNNFGQLGNGTTTNSNLPVAVSTAGVLNGQAVTAASMGYVNGLALANGQAFAWGANGSGELGDGSNANSSVPVAVSTAGVFNGQTVTVVASGFGYSLAVANGQAYAWGSNTIGQLGTGTTTDSSVSVAVSTTGVLNGLTVTAIAAGEMHGLAVANGHVFTWGDNNDGQLGNGTTTNSDVPVALAPSALDNLIVTEIAAGAESSYALTSTGRLFAWGNNLFGEVGIGTTGGFYTTPQEVLPPSGYIWTGIASQADSDSALAIATPMAVPEPGALALIAAAGLAAAGFRRRAKKRCIAAPSA